MALGGGNSARALRRLPVLRHPWSALLAPYSRNLLDVSAPSAVISCGYCCAPAAAYEATHETAYEAVCGEMWRTRRRMRLFALLLLLALPPCDEAEKAECGGCGRTWLRAYMAAGARTCGRTRHSPSTSAAATSRLLRPSSRPFDPCGLGKVLVTEPVEGRRGGVRSAYDSGQSMHIRSVYERPGAPTSTNTTINRRDSSYSR